MSAVRHARAPDSAPAFAAAPAPPTTRAPRAPPAPAERAPTVQVPFRLRSGARHEQARCRQTVPPTKGKLQVVTTIVLLWQRGAALAGALLADCPAGQRNSQVGD